MDNLKVYAGITALIGVPIVITAIGIGLSKSKCKIDQYHAHKYLNDKKIVRYIDSEFYRVQGYNRQDDYILVDESQKKLMEFELKNGLIKICDNKEYLENLEKENQDFIEYRYKYIYHESIPHYIKTGKSWHIYYTHRDVEKYSWTTDSEVANATGEERICHNVYEAYKIELDNNGKLKLTSSGEVDSLKEVMDEYPYIKDNFKKVINYNTKEKISYEDGKPTQSDLDLTNNLLISKTKVK